MAYMNELRPKAGDRVAIYGTVTYFPRNDNGDENALIKIDNCTNASRPFGVNEIFPIPAEPEPRKPWEVLREAAKLMQEAHPSSYYGDLLLRASFLENAAAPKPPTLAEVVRAYLTGDYRSEIKAIAAMREALARAENGA